MKNYKKYIFARLFLSMSIIGLIIYGFYTWKFIFREFKENKILFEEKSKNTEVLLKTRFEMINTYLNQIKYDEKFTTFIYEDKIDYYNLTKLQQELRKNSTLIVNVGYTIGIKKDKLDTIVNFVDTSPSEYYYENLGLNLRGDLLNQTLENLRAYETLFYDTEKYLVYFYRDFDVNMVEKFTWIIAVDKEQFFQSIPSYSNYNFIISNDNQEVIIKGKEKVENIAREIVSKKNVYGNVYIFREGALSVKEIIIYILVRLLFPFLMLLIFIYLFTKSISELLYNPIKDLKKNLEINDKDSIELIEDTYSRLRKQNEFLEGKAKNIDLVYREKQVKDFVLGISDKKAELLIKESYNMLLLEISDDDKYEENYSKEYLLSLKTKIEMLMKERFSAHLLDIDYKSICFIYDESFKKEYVEHILKVEMEEFDIDMGGTVVEGVEVDNLPSAYKDLVKLLEYRFVLTREFLISRDRVEGLQDTSYYYTFDIERKLVKKIMGGNLLGVYEVLDDIFDENLNKRNINIDNIIELESQLINTLKRVGKHQDKEIDLEKLVMVKSINEFIQVTKEVVKDLCEESEQYQDKNEIKKAIEKYLDEHYKEDISLDIMSEYIGFSSKYLSSLYKQLFGENFKTTLDQKRIEKAKEIMRVNPHIKIKDLAEEIGYNSANTFIRVFKKYEGVSPGTLRDN